MYLFPSYSTKPPEYAKTHAFPQIDRHYQLYTSSPETEVG